MTPWKIWVDTGGTFTDCLAIDPHQQLHRLKVLSNSVLRGRIVKQLSTTRLQVELFWPVPVDIYKNFQLEILGAKRIRGIIAQVDVSRGIVVVERPLRQRVDGCTIEIHTNEEVPVFAARLLTKTSLQGVFPAMDMKLGSTRGTNAILERKGAKAALLVTKGFKDILVIGNQQRPDLFTLNVKKETPLYHEVWEVTERMGSDGSVIDPLQEENIQHIVTQLRKKNIESIAVAFVNSYRNPSHEKKVKLKLEQAGFPFVSTSHELSGQVRILPRAETVVANAYLAPIIHQYLDKIKRGLTGTKLKVMSSAGGLIDVNSFYPKDSLLSGPAGGVVGAATVARLSGINKIITFDMGGTSTDVSLYNERFDYRYESQVGAFKILSPSLAIETIAAGGGSICGFDGYRFTVGPESAGANPGPACYGAGGPLTITDVNLLSGRLDPAQFAIPLSIRKSEAALRDLLKKLKAATRKTFSKKEVLLSLLQIANEKMAEAIKKVSTQVGHNPADFTLLSFGGAGGQHACALASMLQMRRILIPYEAGLLSAYGIGHANVQQFNEEMILSTLTVAAPTFQEKTLRLFEKGRGSLIREGYPPDRIRLDKAMAFLRFRGQENTLEIPFSLESKYEQILTSFKKQYKAVFGHWLEHREIEVESIRVIASVSEYESKPVRTKRSHYKPDSTKKVDSAPVYRWEELRAGAALAGPALIVSNNSTTLVDRGWRFVLDGNRNGRLETQQRKISSLKHITEAELELFTNRFTAVAQEMGALLQRTSFSVNVKERLDFSCAVLDADGYLVVNAPHIPVHLGSLGVCVREVMKSIEMKEGDVVLTNHPAFGGSHLPDVTLIKPVYYKKKRIGFVANRAHHAEIGGKKPGSMPADATHLEEEGVIISPTYLVHRGKAQWEKIHVLFTQSKYPTRLWDENQADLNGALAAVNYGERALQELCGKHKPARVTGFMLLLRQYASGLLKEAITSLPSKMKKAEERLDDGSKLCVRIEKKKGKLTVDFTGSAQVHPGNLNATKAIVQSVVLYVLRLLVNKPIPMNEGLMDHIHLVLPHGLLNPDFKKSLPAVVGGNTEVSQRLTDTLLKAFEMAACSQGTMNNFLFGNKAFGYYETICGGTGAGDGFPGTSAVHQHMTNTRITDPELLELRYPVRVVRFEVRKNSGGRGKWKGGDGIVREFFFKDELELNILSQHRKEKPYGLKGGGSGKTGAQQIIRKDGTMEKLKGMDSASVSSGDRLIIETPGGGGYGIDTRK